MQSCGDTTSVFEMLVIHSSYTITGDSHAKSVHLALLESVVTIYGQHKKDDFMQHEYIKTSGWVVPTRMVKTKTTMNQGKVLVKKIFFMTNENMAS
jgi:hypothetical protein